MEQFASNPALRHRLVACLFVLLVAESPNAAFGAAGAQQDAERTATIRTELRDQSGASLPGVGVTLLLQQCRCADCQDKKKCACCPEQRSATSDAEGVVTFVVPGGQYRIRAELAGFATAEREVSVEGGGKSTVTLTFKAGQVASARPTPRGERTGMSRNE